MTMLKGNRFYWIVIYFLTALCGCSRKQSKQAPLFEVLESKQTGLDFTNTLIPTADFNMFNYMYFYNGAGIGAGDFNNDGLVDLFFSSNQGQNKLYINKGGLQFSDVTKPAQIPNDNAWSTGVSVADVNNDGLLDIYVCRVGNFEILHSKNQLLICQGIKEDGTPYYADKAAEYGLDFSGFSTQSAFLDYDMDGDLDMFLMNHGVRNIGTFGERSRFMGTYDSLSGHRLYRNDGGCFADVTKASGINSSAIGYGLGICVSDIDLDGWPDMYIGNDFHENDYLYINQKNGTFKDVLVDRIMHTSQFSMGVDVADINNDALPEIISMDMLPEDPYILKRSLGEDEFNLFNMKLRYGYNPQYARNCLQLNRGNGNFSEIGRYAGVYATDWSWAALWMDFDNDGLKDLFISNGIPKRLNDMDYVNYVSNTEVQEKIRTKNMGAQDMALIDKFPEIKLPNKFYNNKGKAAFDDIAGSIGGNKPTYSNGAIYADLDNDGDLDIVVNNIADPVIIYKNKTNDKKNKAFLQVTVKGDSMNKTAVGAKLVVYSGKNVQLYEKYAVRGFQSSMDIPFHVGLSNVRVDSIKLVWPDNTFQILPAKLDTNRLTINYSKGLQLFNYEELTKRKLLSSPEMEDITNQTGLLYKHEENNFVEFDREPLMPHMISNEGPAVAVADINGDGLDDVFVGAARYQKSCIFLQQPSGKFLQTKQVALDVDSNYEDAAACWADVNNDGHPDLILASGGNEYYGPDSNNTPRIYLNDGKAKLTKQASPFDSLYLTASCVIPYDFNSDGFVDLFIGARAVPFEYGKIPQSYLLENDRMGHFKDVTDRYSKGLSTLGFVTNAVWHDMDADGDKDLVVCCEWGGITAFINSKGRFAEKELTGKKGWWNFVLPCDIDNDGDVDLIAGNLGLNSRLKASEKEPVKMYYGDFDGNGKKEQILTYCLQGKEIPFANKSELEKQIPMMKKKFLYAENFAKASLQEMFSKEKLDGAEVLTADYFSNAVLVNNGNLSFTIKALPWEAQLSCFKDAVIIDANTDKLPDILWAGNFYADNIQMGRYDADGGSILINKGKGDFVCETLNGMQIKGEARHIIKVNVGNWEAFLFARNNDSLRLVRFAKSPPIK